jgi:tetratricopeptide (TPR) repeat protein
VVGLVAVLAAAEGVLRAVSPGQSPRYLVAGKNADGEAVWTDNAFFSYRFFPPRTAPLPLPVRVAKKKPADLLRVVLVGDTAMLGEPDPSFGAGRILEPLLQARAGGKRVEVLSLGLAGGNSHVLREIARDLGRLLPDAVVVMSGNNEISGPYGPASATGRLHTSSRIARLLILANRTRLRQLGAELLARRSPERADARAWKEAEPLTLRDRLERGDPRLRTAERSFRKNYRAVLAAARDAAAVVVPCTVPVNLRGCAPFATAYSSDETEAQKVREAVRAAAALEKAGEADAAYRKYEEALAVNPEHAEALFAAARLAEKLGNGDAAAELYRRARDADALPLRATDAFNEVVRDEARRSRLEPFDAEALYAEISETGVPGNDLFLDHVHGTFAARYRFAAELASRLAWELGLGDGGTAEVPGVEEVSGLLLYAPWGRRYELDALLHKQLVQPFLRQATHAETVSRLRGELEECKGRMDAMPANVGHEVFARRQQKRPDDALLSARAAYYLLQAGDTERAERAAEAALAVWPHRYDARALLAFIRAVEGGGMEDGLAVLKPAGERCGYWDVAFAVSIANNLLEAGHCAAAEPWLDYALKRDPWNSDASMALSRVLYKEDRFEESVAALKRALERTPDNPLLWDELSMLYCLIDEWEMSDEAMEHSERIAPYRFQRLFKRAEALSRLRQYRRAMRPIDRYLEAMPEDPEAIKLREFLLEHVPVPPPADPAPSPRKRMPWE